MTKTQLALGVELSDRIRSAKEERLKYKTLFGVICKQNSQGVDTVGIDPFNDSITYVPLPMSGFPEFLERRIISINELILELESKFKQL